MITFAPSKEDVLDWVNESAANHVDFLVNPKDLKLGVENEKDIAKFQAAQDELEISSLAFSQFLGRLSIPVNFYRKCPDSIKIQLLEHFNAQRSTSYQFRCVKRPEGLRCRGILSSRFTTDLDNHKVIPSALDVLEQENAQNGWLEANDEIFRLETFFYDLKADFEGITVNAGVVITNSEVGQSKLWVDPMILVQRSIGIVTESHQNWMRLSSRVERSTGFTHIHSGVDKEAFLTAVQRAKEAAQIGILQYFEVMQQKITVKEALSVMDRMDNLPKRFIKMLEEENQIQDGMSKRELIKGIWEATSQLPVFQRIAIEHDCSRYLGVFEDVDSRMTKLVQELNS